MYFAVPQAHERRHRKGCSCGFGEQRQDCLYLLQRVGIGFLWFRCFGIDRGISGWVLTLEIVLLFCQREDSADDTLDVFLIGPDEVPKTLKNCPVKDGVGGFWPLRFAVPSSVPKLTNKVTSGEFSCCGATVSDWGYVVSHHGRELLNRCTVKRCTGGSNPPPLRHSLASDN